jgi:nitrate reductase gamma subunit
MTAATSGPGTPNALDTLLWTVLPYVTIAIFIAGHYWRYRYDKFG